MSDYQPIACDFYDVFEIAIMRRRKLLLEWRDGTGLAHQQRVRPRDLRILDGTECLIADGDNAEPLRLRLDGIISAVTVEDLNQTNPRDGHIDSAH